MCKEQGGEIPASALIVTCASGFSQDRREMSRLGGWGPGGVGATRPVQVKNAK